MEEPLIFGPCPVDSRSELEVHILTSKRDARLARWSIMGWYKLNNRRDRLFIHDDGTLDDIERAQFMTLFPGCEVISRSEADSEAQVRLAPYPTLAHTRDRNPMMLRVLDFFFFARSSRFVMLDSDVLHFKPLEGFESYKKLRENVFMQDYHYAFTLHKKDFLQFASPAVYKKVNSGFGIVNAGTLDLLWADFVLRSTEGLRGPYWTGQTLTTILSDPYGIKLLDDSCQVAQGSGIEGLTMKHYVGGVRSLAYSEGLPRLQQLLNQERNGR